MIVLALDTSTRAGSAALVHGGRLLAEIAGDPSRMHAVRLPAELMTLLEAAGLTLSDVDLLAVAAGPGSFTGLRVGIATMQGLAMAAGKSIVPVSTLDALARAASFPPASTGSADAPLIAAWLDAQRGEVFAATYQSDGCTPVAGPTSLPPEETLADAPATGQDGPPRRRIRFVGDGAVRYASVIDAALGPLAEIVPDVPLLASHVAWIAAAAPQLAVRPHHVAPIYVRRPDVELARERRARSS